ncbi:KAP family P-loop domain protein [compost metagenome]
MPQYILNEAPIISDKEDIFNFSHYAKKVDLIIQRNTTNSEPLTVGIYGKWGEGKTSFLNLLDTYISDFKGNNNDKRIIKYHYNPWRYSTQDEMLFDFFEGLSKTLSITDSQTLKKAGKYILQFSRYLKAVKLSASIGLPTNRNTITFEPSEIFKSLGEDLIGKSVTLEKLKEKIDLELQSSEYKIAIFIDDIDRLDKDEIYTLLKIIKLNANFKNLIYLIALDPEQVSKAIHHRYGNDKNDGKLFIEKIINVPIILPRIEKEDLQLFFDLKISSLNKSLDLNKNNELKEIAFEFRNFHFNTPREIIRVINSFAIGAFAIGGEVNLRDLFWIEYLKITNEECYNEIKNYNNEINITSGITGIIDFNDEHNSNVKPNGFRKQLIDKYPSSKLILQHLFPSYSSNSQIFEENLDSKTLEKELRINSIEHFEKYFSYHTFRKVSEAKIKNIKNLIEEQNISELKRQIIELFSRHAEYKTIYKLEAIIDDSEKKEYLFFCRFLLHNIEVIPNIGEDMFGRSFRTRIIEKVGTKLNEENIEQKFILELAHNLGLFHLCYFTSTFTDDKKEPLYDIIIQKAKLLTPPFYEDPLNVLNKMIMQLWENKNSDEFRNYINHSLNKNNILLLIRNFPAFWNNKYFGSLTNENYNFMKSVINVDLIYKKLNEYHPELFQSEIDLNTIESDEIGEKSLELNTQQFIHWYRLDKIA